MDLWDRAEEGFIMGNVIEIYENNNFVLMTLPDKKIYYVSGDYKLIPEVFELEIGLSIAIIGDLIDRNNFVAKIIKPFLSHERPGFFPPKPFLPFNSERNIFPMRSN